MAVALRFEEPATLFDSGLHYWVVVASKRDFRTVCLEEILVDMKALPESLEGGFQPLHCVLLSRGIEAFIVDALNLQDHPEVSRLCEKRCLIPETVKIDVVIESGALFPWLDNLVEAQH
jgi:hypothetical protein